MTVDFQCQGCGQTYRVGSDKVGRMLRCKLCGATTPIPSANEAVVVAYAEPAEEAPEKPHGKSREKVVEPKSSRIVNAARSGRLKSGSHRKKKSHKKTITLIASACLFLVAVTGAFYGVRAIFRGGSSAFDSQLLKYVSADAAGAIIVHPAKVMKSHSLSDQSRTHLKTLMPANIGVEISDVDVAALIFKKPNGGGFPGLSSMTLVMHFKKPPDMDALAKRIVDPKSTESASHAGKSYTKMTSSPVRFDFANGAQVGKDGIVNITGAYSPDKQTLVIAPEQDIKKFLSGEIAASPLRDRLDDFGTKGDLTVVVSDDLFDEATSFGLPNGLPVPEQKEESAQRYKGAAVCLDIDGTVFARFELEAPNAEAAAELQKEMSRSAEKFKAFSEQQHKMVGFLIAGRIPQDEVARLEVFQTFAKGAFVRRSGSKVTLNFKNTDGIADAMIPAIAESVAHINELRDAVDEDLLPDDEDEMPAGAAAAAQAGLLRMNKMAAKVAPSEKLKKIGEAFKAFHDANGVLPMPGPLDRDRKPLLSWRVQLLPFMGEKVLHSQFHLDEPWDSPHNKPLVDRIPDVYKSSEGVSDGKTQFVVFTGDGTPFNGIEPVSLKDFTDGLPGTLLVIETAPGLAVEWTKPQDVAFTKALDQRLDLGLGMVKREGVQALMADGNVIVLSDNIWPIALKSIITYDQDDADATLKNFVIGGNPPQLPEKEEPAKAAEAK